MFENIVDKDDKKNNPIKINKRKNVAFVTIAILRKTWKCIYNTYILF